MSQNSSQLRPFHVAVPVNDLDRARDFYGRLLGCTEGRSDRTWVDFNLFGHQFVCHLQASASGSPSLHNEVDGDQVPVPHYGVVLRMTEWRALADRLHKAGVEFVIEPHIRFAGRAGEQGTLFLLDPSGNALEFKGLDDLDRLFTPQNATG
jgi:extradiol dioxygenase family protein